MRILFIGDTHGSIDLDKLSEEKVKELQLNNNDVIIHCGDIGVPWNENDLSVLEYWRNLPCQVIVNLGNHENYNWIEKQPLIERYGGKGYQMGENIFAPLIGEILTVHGKTFWFYPGAYSIDYGYRTLNKSIYTQELPLKADSDKAVKYLKEFGKVDVIISHDGPREFVMRHFGYPIRDISDSYLEKVQQKRGDRVHPGFVLDEIMKRTDLYDYWYFGHHHKDYEAENIRCLMNQMVLWNIEDNNKQDIV